MSCDIFRNFAVRLLAVSELAASDVLISDRDCNVLELVQFYINNSYIASVFEDIQETAGCFVSAVGLHT